MWTAWICDTMTGARRQKVPLASSWERVLNDTGGGTASINLLSSKVRGLPVRDLTELVRNMLVLDYKGRAVYAGILWDRVYSRSTGRLELKHLDIRSILAARKALEDGGRGWPITTTKLAWQGLSLGTLVKRLVEAAMDSPNGRLPIVLPPDEYAQRDRNSYYGYSLPWTDELIDNLTNVQNGPDVDFQPAWEGDALRLVLRTGTEASPAIIGRRHEWTLGARSPGISDLQVRENAEKMAGRVWAVGDGMDESMLLSRQPSVVPPSTFPLLEREISHKTVTQQWRLDEHAAAAARVRSVPTEQWKFSIKSGRPVAVSDLALGDIASLWVQDDPWLPNGWADNRIIAYSGDMTPNVDLTFQPHEGPRRISA